MFGEVADAYDDVRPGYPAELFARILSYAGRTPASIVESGAGTGKATVSLRALGVPVTCIEPDAAMAARLARRFPDVSIVESRFEDWTPPPGGVDLIASAQAWHWVDPVRRTELAARALAPGGVLAVFGHEFGFLTEDFARDINEVYLRIAPEISHRDGALHPGVFHPDEWRGSPWFGDVEQDEFVTVVPYPTERYISLLSTFSPHRLLPSDVRQELWAAIAEFVDAHGGVLEQKLTTTLCLARRITPDL